VDSFGVTLALGDLNRRLCIAELWVLGGLEVLGIVTLTTLTRETDRTSGGVMECYHFQFPLTGVFPIAIIAPASLSAFGRKCRLITLDSPVVYVVFHFISSRNVS
jgi:hypothetical protein